MAYNNISQVVSAEDQKKAIDTIILLKSLFPFLINLTPEERKKLRKMGLLRTGYVAEVLNATVANSTAMPANFSIPEFQKDKDLDEFLLEVFSAVKPFYDGLESTIMALGAECMKQADEAYGHLKLEGQRSQNQALNSTLKRIGEMHKKSTKKSKSSGSGTKAA